MKGYLTTYGKRFLPHIKPFLNETAFYAKLSGRCLGPKTKVGLLIDLKFRANMQLNNLKLLSKFHIAKPIRSPDISKSLETLHPLVWKWSRKTKEYATRASVVLINLV